MPDQMNALAPPQFSQPQPFGNAQPAQNYDDAISQAWHQSYSQNNPAEYEANYRAPSAYENVTAALHHLALNAGPMNIDPARIDAARAADAARPMGDVVSDAFGTAARGANPLTAMAMGGARMVGNALAPTQVGSEEPSSVATPDETKQLNDLKGQLDKQNGDRAKAFKDAPTIFSVDPSTGARTRMKDPKSTEAIDRQIADTQSQIRGLYKAWSGRREAKLSSEAPFAQTASPETKNFLANTPAVGGTIGAVGGLIKNSPLSYALSTGFAGLEGAGAAFYPTYRDLQLPSGSPAEVAARARLSDPSFWMTHVLPEAGYGAGAGALGSYYGGRAREVAGAVGNAIKGGYNALRGAPVAASSGNALAPAPPQSGNGTAPAPVTTTAAGRDIHLGANGRSMYQDSAGRWQHVGGGMVRKEHRPLWAQTPSQ